MFHRAVELKLKEGTIVEVTFQDGKVMQYDMMKMADKYPVFLELQNRKIFEEGKLFGNYGIVWSDDIDIETEVIYSDGVLTDILDLPLRIKVAYALSEARTEAGLSQQKLAELSGIDQSDISKIERGAANASIATIEKIIDAMEVKPEFILHRIKTIRG